MYLFVYVNTFEVRSTGRNSSTAIFHRKYLNEWHYRIKHHILWMCSGIMPVHIELVQVMYSECTNANRDINLQYGQVFGCHRFCFAEWRFCIAASHSSETLHINRNSVGSMAFNHNATSNEHKNRNTNSWLIVGILNSYSLYWAIRLSAFRKNRPIAQLWRLKCHSHFIRWLGDWVTNLVFDEWQHLQQQMQLACNARSDWTHILFNQKKIFTFVSFLFCSVL